MGKHDYEANFQTNIDMLCELVERIRLADDKYMKAKEWLNDKKYNSFLNTITETSFPGQKAVMDFYKRMKAEKKQSKIDENFYVMKTRVKYGDIVINEKDETTYDRLADFFKTLNWDDDENFFKRGKYFCFYLNNDNKKTDDIYNEENYVILKKMLKRWKGIRKNDNKKITLNDYFIFSSVLKSLIPRKNKTEEVSDRMEESLYGRENKIIDKFIFSHYIQNKQDEKDMTCGIDFLCKYCDLLIELGFADSSIKELSGCLSELKAVSPKGYKLGVCSMYSKLFDRLETFNKELLEEIKTYISHPLERYKKDDAIEKVIEMFDKSIIE